MNLLVQKGSFDYYRELVSTALTLGIDCKVFKYIPFDGSREGLDNIFAGTVFPYGSVEFVRYIQNQSWNWLPKIHYNKDNFLFSNYHKEFGIHSIHYDYTVVGLSEFRDNWAQITDKFKSNGVVFIRPDSNEKEFNGEIVDISQMRYWLEDTKDLPDVDVVISKPSKIDSEYRFVVRSGEVVCGSMYRLGGKLTYIKSSVPDEVKDIAKIWKKEDLYCLDVAKTASGYKVVEISSVNCSGLYAIDLGTFLMEIFR